MIVPATATSCRAGYSFGSGSAHSPWIGGGALELRDGEFVPGASGMPLIRAYFVPRERVEFLDNWDVMGLAGTGSYDYEVPEQTVARRTSPST